MQIRPPNAGQSVIEHCRWRRPGARDTHVAWRQVHFAAKPASHGFAVGTPKGSDFAAGKVLVY
jgi:hypothetical protein